MCVKALVKGTLIGGVALFIWSTVSWMVLPFHMSTTKPLPNEKPVLEWLSKSITAPGIYVYPSCCKASHQATHASGAAANTSDKPQPSLMMIVRPSGPRFPMPLSMGLGFLMNLLAGLMLTGISLLMGAASFKNRFLAMWFAAALGGTGVMMNWIWMGYPFAYVGAIILDLVVGGALAAVLIAQFVEEKPKALAE